VKNAVFWDAILCGSCKPEESEEGMTSIIRTKRIGELGTLAIISSITFHPDDGGATFLRNIVLIGTTRHHIPEDGILHSNRREYLKY
jgi:hypothetical protein